MTKHFRLYGPWRIYLDRTNWKSGIWDVNILMLAVVTGRFRIPLIWTVLDKAGFSSSIDRIAPMQRYLKLSDTTSIRMLLAGRVVLRAGRSGRRPFTVISTEHSRGNPHG